MALVESPQMVSSVKLPILKKGEYTLWSMRMEYSLTNTDYGLWHVIMNGDEAVQTTRDENDVETDDAKSLWAAIKSLDKAYDRFQKLISLLKVHGVTVSNEDANQKFLRALPSSQNNIALIIRNKEGIDELDIDDLYNNLKVFKDDIKGSSGSYSNSQNVAFLFAKDTNNINEVNTANSVSTAAGHSSSGQASSSSYTDDLMFLFFSYVAQKEPTEFALMAYTLGSDTEKNEVAYEEKIAVLEFEVKDKDKTGLGYVDQLSKSDNEVLPSVFDSHLSDADDNPTKDRFKKGNGYHAVPPPLTGNYMPRLADLSFVGLDDSVYRPTANKASASISKDTQVDLQTTVKPSFKKIEFTKARNESVKSDKQADKPNMETVNTVRINGVNTTGQTSVSTVERNGVTAVKTSAGFVTFGGSTKGGKITGIGKIKTKKIDFEDVFFVTEQKFNLFFVSQMCDKKISVLFTKSECLVLFPDFKVIDESQVLLRVPKQNNMYSFDLKNVVPSGDLTCLFTKAIIDESNLWNRRLGHVNFKTMNKLVKGNLVRGKFDGKSEEGFLVGYSVNIKAFRVFNTQTRKVKENLHVNFLENKPNVAGQGPNWLFDIDSLANSMNYQPVIAGNQANKIQNVLERMMNQEKEATEQSDDVRKEFQAQYNS
uniref:Ribonuclease H-like domain-containing protein n=1 Tax=Tanacetum cinerariifolium TaxID=118510 RepID=A0A6L2MTW7_TANCI|nr:ribonuclease H-like domain-containing protein [Tanacetum cinerariifolium]